MRRPHSEETKRKISEAKRRERNPFYGKHLSEQHRRNIAEAMRGKAIPPEVRLKISQSRRGKPAWNKGRAATTEERETARARQKKIWESPEYREHMSAAHRGQKSALGHRLSDEAKHKAVETLLRACRRRPTKIEKVIEDVLQEVAPGEFAYNGDLSLGIMIGGMVPDFVNVNGQKKVIEVFGDYWHSLKVDSWKRTELGRLMAYHSIGYKCLVIWQSEIAENLEKVYRRVAQFIKEK